MGGSSRVLSVKVRFIHFVQVYVVGVEGVIGDRDNGIGVVIIRNRMVEGLGLRVVVLVGSRLGR